MNNSLHKVFYQGLLYNLQLHVLLKKHIRQKNRKPPFDLNIVLVHPFSLLPSLFRF